MSVLFSDGALIVYEAALGIVLVANSIRMYQKNKKLKETVSLQKDRIREEELDTKLQNQLHMERSAESTVKNNPYEVNYHEEADASYENERAHISILVEESGTLSNKKYVVHIFDRIKIGRDDSNKIILNDTTISGHQIELMRVDTELFARNLDIKVKVTLRRKRRQLALRESSVCLLSGDELKVGKTTLRITII